MTRPVPHIHHTPELEAAAVAVLEATDSAGRPVLVIRNAMNVDEVRDKLCEIGRWFVDPSFFFPDAPAAELSAVNNLILLATLLREHLRAGNTT